MFKKILLPVDLSDKHAPALAIAGDLARQSGGEVMLLHVIEVIAGLTMEEEKDFYDRLEKSARKHLAQLGERLRQRQVPWRGDVVFGVRVPEIARYAGTVGADLIVLTSPRPDATHPAATWGSLSYRISILASCPVLLVK